MQTSLRSKILFLLIFFLPYILFAQNRGIELKKVSIEDYIKEYAPLCQEEMKRTGIPASIKLAQGILESNYGNSKLAQKANNHFGIKCHSGWTGKGYYMDDDAKDECFRVYKHVEDSYMDHSNFLMTRSRYAFLFELDSKDYKSWAKGLKRAGYATNPQYANLLIRVIEERKLYNFDDAKGEDAANKTKEELLADLNNKIYVFNGIKTVVSQPGETAEMIAEKYQLTLRQLLKYNDFENENEPIKEGSKVYLQPKKKKGLHKFHIVKEHETMASISQTEGIKLNALFKKNQMEPGEEPQVGERLCLKRKCKTKPAVKTKEQIRKEYEQRLEEKIRDIKEEARQKRMAELEAEERRKAEERARLLAEKESKDTLTEKEVEEKPVEELAMTIEVEKPIEVEEKLPKDVKTDQVASETKTTDTKENYQSVPTYHIVEPKQTLYAISRLYGVKVDELLSWNQLSNPNLEIGQQLIVKFENLPFVAGTERAPMSSEELKEDLVGNTLYPLYHAVAKGETLYRISVNNNITVGQLLEWNRGIETNNLSIGDLLIIGFDRTAPDVDSTQSKEETSVSEIKNQYHVLKAGETLYSLSKKYNVSLDDLKKWNSGKDFNDLDIGDKLIVGKSETVIENTTPEVDKPETPQKPLFHTVAAKETLYGISKMYNITVPQIREWNGLKGNELNIGQKLIIGYE